MKIFISWSGDYSKSVAELLRDWIRCVLQTSEPWVSSQDLERGTVWFSELRDSLDKSRAGIICLTQENKVRPWILFEAGAIFKGLEENRICTFLADLEPKDVGQPLAQFNHTMPTKDGLRSLVTTLNRQLERRLDDRILQQVFETYWPSFVKDFNEIQKPVPTQDSAPRKDSDILGEILDATRSIGARVASLEQQSGRAVRLTPSDVWQERLSLTPDMFADEFKLKHLLKQLLARDLPEREIRIAIERVAPDSNSAHYANEVLSALCK